MKHNDLIRRADALRLLDENGVVFRCEFEEIPAVNAVPVVFAQWEEESDRYFHWHCSKCGFVHGIACNAFKYCPNCGAKMSGGEGEETDENIRKD